MKILVTGATGFVGAHTVLALLQAGHHVRLLVRRPEAAKQYFAARGFNLDEVVVGDMCDREIVKQALGGCDAVVHSAAMVSLDPKDAEKVFRTNVEGVKTVIGAALEQGIKNILYVSSYGALFNPAQEKIDETSPVGTPSEAYSRSKAECERYVRELQAQGAPIQVSYPVGVFGPDDPGLSESNEALVTFLTTMVPVTTSGIQTVDVRDVSNAHRYILEQCSERRGEDARYILGGHFSGWKQFGLMLESVTGQTVRKPAVPAPLFRGMGRLFDLLRKMFPISIQISTESMQIVTQWRKADSSRIEKLMGEVFRPQAETFIDTIRWLVDSGHLDKKFVNRMT